MIYARVRAVTRRDPGRVAIIDDGRAVTYEDLVGRSDAFARSLAGPSGVSQGDTVLALLGNSADFVALFLAVARLGAVMMPIDPALTDRELGAYLGRFAIRVAITTAAFRRQRPGALAGLGEAPWLAIEALGDGIDEPAPARRAGPFAGVVAAVSTSGSTGSPRVVGRTQGGLLAGFESLREVVEPVPGDRILGVVPFRHSHGLANAMLLSLLSGGTLVVMSRFLPRPLIEVLTEHRVSVLVGSPFIFATVAECVEDRTSFATVRVAISSGAAVPPATARAFQAKTGVAIRELYGSSETGVIAVGDPDQAPDSRSARPVPGVEVRVVDESGAVLAPGATGEVLVRSDIMAAGYLGEPGNGQFPLRDGYYPTGDLGRIDAGGNLVLEGRLSLRLNIAGVKIDPVEVERVILALPQVAKVAVSSATGERGLEVIKASVVLAEGHALAREALIAHCRRELAEYKVPRIVELVDALPETVMGKRVAGFSGGLGDGRERPGERRLPTAGDPYNIGTE